MVVHQKADSRVRNDADETEVHPRIIQLSHNSSARFPYPPIINCRAFLGQIWDNPRGATKEQAHEGSASLSTSNEHKRSTASWNDQDKFDTRKFFLPYSTSSLLGDSSLRACAMNDYHKKMLAHVDVWEGASKTMPRIFCGIFTHRKTTSRK
ncbi:unnamed protein product [Ectocarpus fasciculatus]